MASKSTLARALLNKIAKGVGNAGEVTTQPSGKAITVTPLKSDKDLVQRGNELVGGNLTTNINEKALAALPEEVQHLAILYGEEDARRQAISSLAPLRQATGRSDFFSTGPVPKKLKEDIASGTNKTIISRQSQSPRQIEDINTKGSVTGEIQSPLELVGEGATVSKQREPGVEEIIGFTGAGEAIGNPRAVAGHNLRKAIQANQADNRPATAEDVLGYITTANTEQGIANVARSMKGQFPAKEVPNVEFAERTLSGPEMAATQKKAMAAFTKDFQTVMKDPVVQAFLEEKPFIKNRAASMATLMQAYIRLKGLGSLSPSTERIFAEFNAGRPNIGLPQGVVREGATSKVPLRVQDRKRGESTLNDPELLKTLKLQARKEAAAVKDQPQAKDVPTIPEGHPEQFVNKADVEDDLKKQADLSSFLGRSNKRRNTDLRKTNRPINRIPEDDQGRLLKAEENVPLQDQLDQRELIDLIEDVSADEADTSMRQAFENALSETQRTDIDPRVPTTERTRDPFLQRLGNDDPRVTEIRDSVTDLKRAIELVQKGELTGAPLTTLGKPINRPKPGQRRGTFGKLTPLQQLQRAKQFEESRLLRVLREVLEEGE